MNKSRQSAALAPKPADMSKLFEQHECGPVEFTGTDGLYGRHLLFDNVIDPTTAPRETLLTYGDHYMHLADLTSYLKADQRLVELHRDPQAWARKAILNVVGCGEFSSDRTIAEYASQIWQAKPCPVP